VPHAGTDTRLWREVVALGDDLERAGVLAGSRAHNRVAMLFDWEAWWACELDSHPSVDVRYLDRAHDLHRSLTDRQVGVDLVHPSADLTSYDVILVPTLYAVTDEAAAALDRAVRAGATAVVTYFSGIVDEHDHIRLGGYPGAFRDLLGIRVEEFLPLPEHGRVRLSGGTEATVWVEDLRLEGAEAVITSVDGPAPGVPVVTRHAAGEGQAWYVATRLDPDGTDALLDRVLDEAGVPRQAPQPGIEVLRRTAEDGRSFAVVVNHTEDPADVAVAGRDVLSGDTFTGTVAAGAVAVVEEA
jgi:beta-galactosidase